MPQRDWEARDGTAVDEGVRVDHVLPAVVLPEEVVGIDGLERPPAEVLAVAVDRVDVAVVGAEDDVGIAVTVDIADGWRRVHLSLAGLAEAPGSVKEALPPVRFEDGESAVLLRARRE